MVRVAFIHPDLGIGGAERLVVDAALALQQQGHAVHVYTAYHDPKRCFSETNNGTLAVHVFGRWIPRNLFGYCHALCAYLQMVYVALMICVFPQNNDVAAGDAPGHDVFVCDQVSMCVPVLRWLSSAKVLFYCHFPDQLLVRGETSALKALYRMPINWLEERTTGLAHGIVVNSRFTGQTFTETFKTLAHRNPAVLYPSLNVSAFDRAGKRDSLPEDIYPSGRYCFLSINRFEFKKNVELAVEAFVLLKDVLPPAAFDKLHLVLAGGYDERLQENRECFGQIVRLVDENGIGDRVSYLKSFTDEQKTALLQGCHGLVYTPSNEHFGIGPLEGMYMRKPVIAVNSGGPTESVVHNVTGYLCKAKAPAFAEAMASLVTDPKRAQKMGLNGRKRVQEKFSFNAFRLKLDTIVREL